MAARDEVLVDLVRDRVGDARGERRQLPSERPQEQRAEDRELGHVRGLPQHESQIPSPEQRLGIEESAKMTAAQTTTGSQTESAREVGIGGHDRVAPRAAVREPGANPGRSRRCEGSCSSAETTGLGREGGGGGSPESEDLPRRRTPNPSRKEDSCIDDSSSWRALALAARSPPALARARARARRRQDEDDLRRGRAALETARTRCRARGGQPRGEFYYHVTDPFGPYVDQIGRYPAAGSSGWIYKVNGVSPPVGADQVVLSDGDTVLWYWATFGEQGGPPTLAAQAASARNCYRCSRRTTRAGDAGRPARR